MHTEKKKKNTDVILRWRAEKINSAKNNVRGVY